MSKQKSGEAGRETSSWLSVHMSVCKRVERGGGKWQGDGTVVGSAGLLCRVPFQRKALEVPHPSQLNHFCSHGPDPELQA